MRCQKHMKLPMGSCKVSYLQSGWTEKFPGRVELPERSSLRIFSARISMALRNPAYVSEALGRLLWGVQRTIGIREIAAHKRHDSLCTTLYL